jgi:hypothetical protein
MTAAGDRKTAEAQNPAYRSTRPSPTRSRPVSTPRPGHMVGRQWWLVVVIGRRLTAWARHDGMTTAWDPRIWTYVVVCGLYPRGRDRALSISRRRPGPSARRRRSTIARASFSVAKSHSMSLPVSRVASTCEHSPSRLAHEPDISTYESSQAPFHHRPRTSTLAGYSYRRSIRRLSRQSCCSLVTSSDPSFVVQPPGPQNRSLGAGRHGGPAVPAEPRHRGGPTQRGPLEKRPPPL